MAPLSEACSPVAAGFRHSAFTFGAESLVAKSNVNGSKIPPGQLVNFIQKGLMYTELEKSVSDEGADSSATAPFQHLQDGSKGSSSKSRDGSKGGGGPSSMDVDDAQGGSADTTLTDEQVTTLSGHTSEVFICAWSPTGSGGGG